MSVIKAENLSRSFAGVKAVDSISLNVEAGCICTMLGPNGAGKSTLMKLLNGNLHNDYGNSEIAGINVRLSPEKDSPVASVIDGMEPFPGLKIEKLIKLYNESYADFDHDKAMAMLNEADYDLKKYYTNLSKGQKRRLLWILAMCANTKAIMLDEPADGLDPAARVEMYQHLRRHVNDTNAAVLITTHIIDDIEGISDTVAIINKGKKILDDDLEDLREQIRIVEAEEIPAINEDKYDILSNQMNNSGWTGLLRDTNGWMETPTWAKETRNVTLKELYLLLTTEV